MTFQKYSLKIQIILALFFIPLNFAVSYLCSQVLQLPFFMDMIFIYSASFFGLFCGFFTSIGYYILWTVIMHYSFLHLLYAICCLTGVLLTWLFVTKRKTYEDHSVLWIRLILMFFVSTVVISFEGSLIYSIFFLERPSPPEITTVMFLTYTLVMQNLGVQLSAFLARLPVNLFDKAIAVFGGFGIYFMTRKILSFVCQNNHPLPGSGDGF